MFSIARLTVKLSCFAEQFQFCCHSCCPTVCVFIFRPDQGSASSVQTPALQNTFLSAQLLSKCHLHLEHSTSLSGISSVTGDQPKSLETTHPPLARCLDIVFTRTSFIIIFIISCTIFVDVCSRDPASLHRSMTILSY